MRGILRLVVILFLSFNQLVQCNEGAKKSTILVAILIRNKAHTLPYFFSLFENLEYPKDRISLWIRSDNNVDNSTEIARVWLREQSSHYHSVNIILDDMSMGNKDEISVADWPLSRFNHVINLREEALNFGRHIWADYVLMLDADVFLTNANTLDLLISKKETVVAPLLKSDGMYSNFWAGMTPEYYYKRTERYTPILNREKLGCHQVPMVHSAVLIDLHKSESDFLTYKAENLKNYDGPTDDIITFALGANSSGIKLNICNDEVYGFVMTPLDNHDTLERDIQHLINLKLEILGHQLDLLLSENMAKFINYPIKDSFNMDKIFMINLLRRPERRMRMYRCFDELGIEAETITAVDGRNLNETILKSLGIKTMPEYIDPYHKRPMKMGEIGCFLSHYSVWKKIIDENLNKVMVLEDDVRFEPFFRNKVNFIMNEIDKLAINWDLIYLGRKRMQEQDELFVSGSNYLVHAGYSYWTLGYILSNRGAKKLLEAKPLSNLVPVDEYLPIMFNKHPQDTWKQYFPKRDLLALSVSPLLVYPTHYTGDTGYVSDTENSNVIETKAQLKFNEKNEL